MTDEQKALEWASLRIRDIEKELDPRKDVFPPSKKTQLEYELDVLRTILSALEPKVMRDWVNKWVPVFTEGLRPQIYIANMLNELGIAVKDAVDE